jgi:RND family efflux transporter MFP subunit
MSNTLSVAGEFHPYQEVELHAKVSGYLRQISVDIGDRVRAGQVLATLEIPELNAELVGAQAGVRHTRQEILRAQDEVKRSIASHDAIHSAAIRLQQASDARPGLIAQQELDDALAKDRSAEAQVEAANSDLAAAQEKLAVSQASSTQVSAMNDYSRIVAPFDGVVTWRYADTGALIQAGTSNSNSMPVVKLAAVNTLRLRIPVPESLVANIHIGDLAKVRVQATGAQFDGAISRFTDSLDRSTRTMQVEIDVPNTVRRLAPGMYADVTLQLETKQNTLSIPVMALRRDNDKSSVLALDPENHVHVRDVRTGVEDANRVEIKSGLREGDRVIVGNLGAYHDGELVAPAQSKMIAAANAGGND